MERCPFKCGESGGTDLHVVIPYDDGGGFFVECSDCGSAGPDGDDADGAIAAWNERAQSFAGINRDVHPTSLHGEIERLTRDQDEWKDLALRNQASMENYVRRLGDSESICRVAESEIARLKDQLTAALLERDNLTLRLADFCLALTPFGDGLAHGTSPEKYAIRILREQRAKLDEVIGAAHDAGWDGVNNPKDLSMFIRAMGERLDEQAAEVRKLKEENEGPTFVEVDREAIRQTGRDGVPWVRVQAIRPVGTSLLVFMDGQEFFADKGQWRFPSGDAAVAGAATYEENAQAARELAELRALVGKHIGAAWIEGSRWCLSFEGTDLDPNWKERLKHLLHLDPPSEDALRAHSDDNVRAALELAELRGRLEEWCCTFGAGLIPTDTDTYGDGVRASKSQVALLLQPRPAGWARGQHTDNDDRCAR